MGFFNRAIIKSFNEVEINGQKLGADADDEQEDEGNVGETQDTEEDDATGEIPEGDADSGEEVSDDDVGTDDTGEQPGEDIQATATAEIPPQTNQTPEGDDDVSTGESPEEGEIAEPANDVATDTDYDIPDDDTGEIDDDTDGDNGEIGGGDDVYDDNPDTVDNGDSDGEIGEDDSGSGGDDPNAINDDPTGDGTAGEGSGADTTTGGDGEYDNEVDDTGEVGDGDGTIDDSGEEGDDTGDDDNSSSESINDDIKNIENNILADLSDEQKQIQSNELRQNFINMYNSVVDIIDKINNVQKDEDSLSVFEFISTQLLILKDTINMTITKTFDTKSYFENMTTYQHCLAILSSVDELIKETEKKQKCKED